MGGRFGKYGHAKRKAQVLKNQPRVKGGTEKREKDMYKNYARSLRTYLHLPRLMNGEIAV
ncbi:MAG: hypothetical protein JRJ43_10580 [Deltaproteobacteria bacterium]|nr:hypothetical protein [Deltaproteobacteria bacterium]